MTPRRPVARLRPAAALCVSIFSACWTGAASPSPLPPSHTGGAPSAAAPGPCPTRLVVEVHDRATKAPLAGATVVVSTDDGRVAVELTDEHGRLETAAVRPPAKLTVYYGELTVEHALATCQPPLRLGVDLGH
jgi:hypothetical protein